MSKDEDTQPIGLPKALTHDADINDAGNPYPTQVDVDTRNLVAQEQQFSHINVDEMSFLEPMESESFYTKFLENNYDHVEYFKNAIDRELGGLR